MSFLVFLNPYRLLPPLSLVAIAALVLVPASTSAQLVSFTPNSIRLPLGVDAGDAKPADLDGDGDLDFVIRHHTGEANGEFMYRVSWVRNNGNNNWQLQTDSITGNPEPNLTSFEVADLDSDGDLDVVTGSAGTLSGQVGGADSALRVYTNDGTGSFTVNTILSVGFFDFFADASRYIQDLSLIHI